MVHEFKPSKKVGDYGEKILRPHIPRILVKYRPNDIIKNAESELFEYTRNREYADNQKRGMDATIRYKADFVEIKTRNPYVLKFWRKYGHDILVETISNDKKNTKGWGRYTEAPVVIYGVLAECRKSFAEIYLIDQPRLYDFLFSDDNKYKEYEKKLAANEFYNTVNRVVPVSDFPDGVATRLDRSFLFDPGETVHPVFEKLYSSEDEPHRKRKVGRKGIKARYTTQKSSKKKKKGISKYFR